MAEERLDCLHCLIATEINRRFKTGDADSVSAVRDLARVAAQLVCAALDKDGRVALAAEFEGAWNEEISARLVKPTQSARLH